MSTAEQPTIDNLLLEWEDSWLQPIKHQIYEISHRRQLHDEFMDLLRAQDHPDTYIFEEVFHNMYIESQVMAIRRQVDGNKQTLSLRRLIGQLQRHRRKFTRSWYVARWMKGRDLHNPNERERWDAEFHFDASNRAFDEFTDNAGDSLLGGRRLQADCTELEQSTQLIVDYANSAIAHSQRLPMESDVTYDDFHGAIEQLQALMRRYYLLIDQGGLTTTTPHIQGDWMGPFRKPLAPAAPTHRDTV